MYFKCFFYAFLLSMGVNALANIEDASHNTVPFIIYQSLPINQSCYTSRGQVQAPISSKICLSGGDSVMQQVDISSDKIRNTIRNIQNTICNVVTDNTDIKVWFSIDASGKLFGIGTATQSGLEITFHCTRETKKST
ncbi:MAG: hypothetical protein K2Q14_03935 [Gammaproteobacteria bacterium]|nr:hypothetical protein [Gammaproteobacteria bacterium]